MMRAEITKIIMTCLNGNQHIQSFNTNIYLTKITKIIMTFINLSILSLIKTCMSLTIRINENQHIQSKNVCL